jgi:hypothetical protein
MEGMLISKLSDNDMYFKKGGVNERKKNHHKVT